MEKRIIVGSIIAVAVLIGISFTGVVGYQTTKSSTIAKVSPLFSVRTSRALDKESKDFTCDYVGKGNTLPFPERDDKAVLIQKVIDRISKMDDVTIEKLIAFLINHARKDKGFNDGNPNKIREALYLLRYSDKPIPIFDLNTKNKYFPLWTPGCTPPPVTFGNGIEGFLKCILFLPFYLIVRIIGVIFDCFNLNTGSMVLTACCQSMNCPITFRK